MISAYSDRKQIRLFFEDALHLWLWKKELVGMQAYYRAITSADTNKGFSGATVYVIEYTTRTGVITTEYGKREDWEEILRLLEGHLPGS